MRRLLLTLLLLGLASPSWAAIAERAAVKATKGGVTADSTTLAFANNISAADLLTIAGAISDTVSVTAVTATDTVSTSYTCVLGTVDSGGTHPFHCYGLAPSSGANTVTVNPNEASNTFDFAIDAFTGVHATPLDGAQVCATAGSGPGALSVNHTTNASGAMVIGTVATAAGDSKTPGATLTQIGENETALDGFNAQFKVMGAAGVQAVDWTSIDVAYSVCTISFAPAGAGSTRRPVAPMVFP